MSLSQSLTCTLVSTLTLS